MLAHVPKLRRLNLSVGSVNADFNLALVTTGGCACNTFLLSTTGLVHFGVIMLGEVHNGTPVLYCRGTCTQKRFGVCAGLQGLTQLQGLNVTMKVVRGGPLLSMLEVCGMDGCTDAGCLPRLAVQHLALRLMQVFA